MVPCGEQITFYLRPYMGRIHVVTLVINNPRFLSWNVRAHRENWQVILRQSPESTAGSKRAHADVLDANAAGRAVEADYMPAPPIFE